MLAIHDLEKNTEVLGERIWWNYFTHNEEPWAKFWNTKYVGDQQKNDIICFNEDSPGSHIWSKTFQSRRIVQDHNFWEIRYGEDAHFWDDSWQQFPMISLLMDSWKYQD